VIASNGAKSRLPDVVAAIARPSAKRSGRVQDGHQGTVRLISLTANATPADCSAGVLVLSVVSGLELARILVLATAKYCRRKSWSEIWFVLRNSLLVRTLVPRTSADVDDGGRHGIWSRRAILAAGHSNPHHHFAGLVLAPLTRHGGPRAHRALHPFRIPSYAGVGNNTGAGRPGARLPRASNTPR
jgi:hypothetical protein